MKKRISSIMAILFLIFMFTSCTKQEVSIKTDGNRDKVKVVVSFNPVREFVEAIGKEKVDVSTIIPEGVEPHDFEPKPKDMKLLNEAQIFVYNGLGMESWVEKTLQVVDNKQLKVVEASKGATLLKNQEEKDVKEHGTYDPHIWLSVKEAKVEGKNIRDALIKEDEKNKEFYTKNYEEFAKNLDAVYEEYAKKMGSLTNKNFVTGHAAFAYLCRDFGLTQKSVEGVFAEGEPTAFKIKELVEYSKANKVKVIFLEELASPKVSETLAKEVGGKTLKIYTIESKENNKTYIESMRENLENIYNSLKD